MSTKPPRAELLAFAAWLRRARLARRISQNALAERMGVSKSAVSEYERALRRPYVDSLLKVADELGASIEELIGMLPSSPSEQPLAPALMTTPADETGRLTPVGDATPQLAEAHFFGLVSELGTLTDEERAAVLPVLREIVGRRRADPGGRGAGGGRAGAGGAD